MNPSFSDIQYFIEVANTGNISRAAERLGLTQPSLSAAIKRLEDSLSSQLLLRSRTGVQLTKQGNEFLSKSRHLVRQWDQLKSEIHKNDTEVSGRYILGCHPSVALYSLSKFLPELIQNHPNLEIQLTHDLSRKVTEQVVSFEIDIAIVVNPVAHPDLVIKELCRDEVKFWTAAKPSITQKLDSAMGVLICDMDLTQVQKLMSDLNKKKQGFKRVIPSSNLEVIADLTASGMGVGILPERVATKHVDHKLKPLKGGLPIFKDRICLVYRADYQKTRGSAAIIEAIKAADI